MEIKALLVDYGELVSAPMLRAVRHPSVCQGKTGLISGGKILFLKK